jgi:hypothetical protein
MLCAVFIAVIMITGTAPISPARKVYSKTGKIWWTRKFTIAIVVLYQSGIKGKRGLLKSLLSAQHSL